MGQKYWKLKTLGSTLDQRRKESGVYIAQLRCSSVDNSGVAPAESPGGSSTIEPQKPTCPSAHPSLVSFPSPSPCFLGVTSQRNSLHPSLHFQALLLEGTQIQTSRSSLPEDRHSAFLFATLPPHALPRHGHLSCSVFSPGSHTPAHVTS